MNKTPITNQLDAMPDFQAFRYVIAIPPAGSRLIAWDKLRETERRLAMYKWVEELNDPGKAQHRVLLNDSTSAFLLSFEATIQFFKDQFVQANPSQNFEEWLKLHPRYDLYIKGLRTLRHFEAHVESKPIPRTVEVEIFAMANISGATSVPGTSKTTGCTWRLPHIPLSELQKLRSKPLTASDLGPWENLVTTFDAKTVFHGALLRLREILVAAEAVV